VPDLDAATDWLRANCREHEAVFVEGHRETPYQDASALLTRNGGKFEPASKEHFGFTDAISEVAFDGQGADLRVEGGGKITGKDPTRRTAGCPTRSASSCSATRTSRRSCRRPPRPPR
jgi:hypothetical protein